MLLNKNNITGSDLFKLLGEWYSGFSNNVRIPTVPGTR